MLYKNKEWLTEQRVENMRTFQDIADDFGVNRKTVEYFAKKYGISTKKINRNIDKEVECAECGVGFMKKSYYINYRRNKGFHEFFCDDICSSIRHSRKMTGEENPNYGGIFHGKQISGERRSKLTKRQFERYREQGKLDEMMKPVHEGHKKFFSTEEGKRIRQRNGVLAARVLGSGNPTSIEIKMAEELQLRGIEFEEQYNLDDKFLPDFYLPRHGIIIECDGDYWHSLPKVVERDVRKNEYIKSKGISLYRFRESEINESVEACVDIVLAEINEKEAIA